MARERPKTDRVACPWLIRRFIDADAEFIFVPASSVLSVAQHEGAHRFDSPGAMFTHDGNRRTFEVQIDHFGLDADPARFGLLAIGVGGLLVERDDHRLLERASFVYDALYAWCQLETR